MAAAEIQSIDERGEKQALILAFWKPTTVFAEK